MWGNHAIMEISDDGFNAGCHRANLARRVPSRGLVRVPHTLRSSPYLGFLFRCYSDPDLSRVRVWQIVKRVMIEAGIPDGPHRSPKGLRHAFGVHAVVQGVPLHMLQRWLGHAQLSTTALYAEAVGKEEQHIAARMWG